MSFIEYLKMAELEARFCVSREGLFWVIKIKNTDTTLNVGKYISKMAALRSMTSLETAFRDGLFVGRKLQEYDDRRKISFDLSEKVSNA